MSAKDPIAEFTVRGTPISQQGNGSSKAVWKNQVAVAASAAVTPGAPYGGDVRVTVVYYYQEAPLDVDNMIKPIQDAMIGVVYVDDRQVTDATAAKRKLDGAFKVRGMSKVLAEGFCCGEEFVHIRVEKSPDSQELV